MTRPKNKPPKGSTTELYRRVVSISRTILQRARNGFSRIDLLQEISALVIDSSPAEIVEWWLREGDGFFRCAVTRSPEGDIHWEVDNLDVTHPADGIIVGTREQQALSRIYLDLIDPDKERNGEWFTAGGSFWTCDSCTENSNRAAGADQAHRWRLEPGAKGRCFVLIPLRGEDENLGFISLKSDRQEHFSREDIEIQELMAETVAVSLIHQKAQVKLRERIKELRCLYDVLRLADNPELTLDEVLRGVADLLPPAWQYPDVATGRVVLDGNEYCSRGFAVTAQIQSTPICIGGQPRGRIELAYLRERPPMFEGPFLKEERHLIDALASELSGIIERRQVRDDRLRLENQLRHADRLATIGQLAAGVAHELNEPLGNILGFAQLARKAAGISEEAIRDLDRIVDACLYSRKVVSKLKLFARQMPAQRSVVNLNKMITEELFFIESRCAKQGVKIAEDLDPLPVQVLADPGQMYQVLVNLTVNAVQAMPAGGTLTLSTRKTGERVSLEVTDTGVGMTPDVINKIFVPFFTTKGTDQGTGLGLSVVHGIVAAHGGTIEVNSTPGQGTRFVVLLPIGDIEQRGEDQTR